MKKTIRLMLASALMGTAGLAAAASDFLLPFATTSGIEFTQYFSLTVDKADSLYVSVVGTDVQYESLSFDIIGGSPIHVGASLNNSGRLGATFDDLTNTAYSLAAGPTYSLVISGVTRKLASNVRGVVTISGFDGAVSPVITAAVPEPETWAMLLAGLGLVGAVARRRAAAV